MGNVHKVALLTVLLIVGMISILLNKDEVTTMVSTMAEMESTSQTTDTGHYISEPNLTSKQRLSAGPSLSYGNTRRKIKSGVDDVWNYIRGQLNELKKFTGHENNIDVRIDHILNDSGKLLGSIMPNAENLSQVDGYSSRRSNELTQLSNLVQQRFLYLQNPANCSKAKKIVCNFKVECGFGCQVHHLSYCMIMAYATGRTLILESKGWAYANEGWEKFFMPLSETCIDRQGESTGAWGALNSIKDTQVVELPIVGYLPAKVKPDFLPLAIPEDLSERLRAVHGNPPVWWIGQIMAFIMRPRPAVEEFITKKNDALGFTHPIVGIQVRRTDKLDWEAKFHGIQEYMLHAEEFYQKLEINQTGIIRKVFLATDDVGLLNEAKRKYPDYVFISDHTITKSASLSSRFSEDSLSGIIADIHFLAHSDFLVCTCSSNVCRLAYEMMNMYYTDAAMRFRSLDAGFFYQGQNSNSQNKVVKMPLYEGSEHFHL